MKIKPYHLYYFIEEDLMYITDNDKTYFYEDFSYMNDWCLAYADELILNGKTNLDNIIIIDLQKSMNDGPYITTLDCVDAAFKSDLPNVDELTFREKALKANKRVTFCDPPQGWKYGYPKILPESVKTENDLRNFLRTSGYPEKDIELAIMYSRYWEEDEIE